MLQFINYQEADARVAAEKILAMETQLAEPRLDKVSEEICRNFNNPRHFAELCRL